MPGHSPIIDSGNNPVYEAETVNRREVDIFLQRKAALWVGSVLKVDLPDKPLRQLLIEGRLLRHVALAIRQRRESGQYVTSKIDWNFDGKRIAKVIDDVNLFLQVCQEQGVACDRLFETADLTNPQFSLTPICKTMWELATTCEKRGLQVPPFVTEEEKLFMRGFMTKQMSTAKAQLFKADGVAARPQFPFRTMSERAPRTARFLSADQASFTRSSSFRDDYSREVVSDGDASSSDSPYASMADKLLSDSSSAKCADHPDAGDSPVAWKRANTRAQESDLICAVRADSGTRGPTQQRETEAVSTMSSSAGSATRQGGEAARRAHYGRVGGVTMKAADLQSSHAQYMSRLLHQIDGDDMAPGVVKGDMLPGVNELDSTQLDVTGCGVVQPSAATALPADCPPFATVTESATGWVLAPLRATAHEEEQTGGVHAHVVKKVVSFLAGTIVAAMATLLIGQRAVAERQVVCGGGGEGGALRRPRVHTRPRVVDSLKETARNPDKLFPEQRTRIS